MVDVDAASLHGDFPSWECYAHYRAESYRTASAVFAFEPHERHLRALLGKACSIVPGDCVRSCEYALFDRIAKMDVHDLARLRTDIASEYAELFVGPRPPLAPLYESLYVGSPSRLCTDQTERVREFYIRFCYQLTKGHRVPADHIAHELEFLSLLCLEESKALADEDMTRALDCERAQSDFLTHHLGLWANDFAVRVASAGVSEYYLAWAEFVRDFVLDDHAFLGASTASGSRKTYNGSTENICKSAGRLV